ncbi:ead/Ea22-like family protein [Serratia marcescens]|uniref:ead/Ea22-like family protein n=1 Tax=Serratia marcescens TaxID=615 RepID=UPI0039B38D2F
MDKFSELKRRADKCPIKRFKAFIGRANTQATLCADTGIEIIGWSGFDASDLNAKSHRVELARFIAAADPETILAILAELEAKDKRIAELEPIRADASQVFKEIGNELGCNPDNESIMMAIDELKEREKRVVALAGGSAELWETMAARLEAAEAKLATPVRLPNKNDDEFWFDGVFQVAKFDRAVERAISAAGFKFVGDEQ